MSVFIGTIASRGLIERPPVSKVMPLPTTTTCRPPAVARRVASTVTSRGDDAEPAPTARMPAEALGGELARAAHRRPRGPAVGGQALGLVGQPRGVLGARRGGRQVPDQPGRGAPRCGPRRPRRRVACRRARAGRARPAPRGRGVRVAARRRRVGGEQVALDDGARGRGGGRVVLAASAPSVVTTRRRPRVARASAAPARRRSVGRPGADARRAPAAAGGPTTAAVTDEPTGRGQLHGRTISPAAPVRPARSRELGQVDAVARRGVGGALQRAAASSSPARAGATGTATASIARRSAASVVATRAAVDGHRRGACARSTTVRVPCLRVPCVS